MARALREAERTRLAARGLDDEPATGRRQRELEVSQVLTHFMLRDPDRLGELSRRECLSLERHSDRTTRGLGLFPGLAAPLRHCAAAMGRGTRSMCLRTTRMRQSTPITSPSESGSQTFSPWSGSLDTMK